MEKKEEGLFQINGHNSWIHCMRIQGAKAMGAQHSYHYHEYMEFLLFLRGNAKLIVQEGQYFCQAGQLAVVNAGEAHDVLFNEDSDYICIKFLPHIIYNSDQDFSGSAYGLPYLLEDTHCRIFAAEEIAGVNAMVLLQEVLVEWSARQYGCELMIRANLLKVFAAVMRVWEGEGACPAAGLLPPYICRALDHIALHFSTVTEKETAELCGVSYHYFSAAFRKAVGRTFSQHLTGVRIREGKKLLMTTSACVESIAGAVGFATASHFIKRFKDSTGITPVQYRKQRKV